MDAKRVEEIIGQEPEEGPPFQFKPGRHYVAMWNVPFAGECSKFGKGGDVTALLWRKDEEPTTWHFMFRFRHYKIGRDADPWATANVDERVWHKMEVEMAADKMLATIQDFIQQVTTLSGMNGEMDCLPIHGDYQAFYAAHRRLKPHWLFMQTERTE